MGLVEAIHFDTGSVCIPNLVFRRFTLTDMFCVRTVYNDNMETLQGCRVTYFVISSDLKLV
jgi:hypothetical protein